MGVRVNTSEWQEAHLLYLYQNKEWKSDAGGSPQSDFLVSHNLYPLVGVKNSGGKTS